MGSGGTDTTSLKTFAENRGDTYVVNGAKTFITNGVRADFLVCACKTTKEGGHHGISFLILEKGDFFGEMSLLEDLPRTASARAARYGEAIQNGGGRHRSRYGDGAVALERVGVLAAEQLELAGAVRAAYPDGTCAGVTCAKGQVCVSGVCVTGCACRGCPDGQSCVETSNQ